MSPGRKKVLILIPFLTAGGAERVVLMLLRYMDRMRFELHLGLLEARGEFVGEIPEDVALHDLKVSRVRYALPGIVRLVWKVRPHTILSTLGHLNLALMFSKPFLPRDTRLLIREATIPSSAVLADTQYPRVWSWFYKRFYKRADRIVCLSDSMLEDMVEYFDLPRTKVVRIYNPVDVERVRELAEMGNSPYSGSGPFLVAAGRLTRQKGFDVLLSAMPAILKHFPNARLAILGEGPLRTELMNQAQELGLTETVNFLGFQPNPWLYFMHSDLFILPSRYEGLSNTLLEALALGGCAVATDCPGGNREIAKSNPRVVLVPPEDVNSLADAVISVCSATKGFHRQAEESRNLLAPFDLQGILAEYSSLLSN